LLNCGTQSQQPEKNNTLSEENKIEKEVAPHVFVGVKHVRQANAGKASKGGERIERQEGVLGPLNEKKTAVSTLRLQLENDERASEKQRAEQRGSAILGHLQLTNGRVLRRNLWPIDIH
jgi:hypothetical protein